MSSTSAGPHSKLSGFCLPLDWANLTAAVSFILFVGMIAITEPVTTNLKPLQVNCATGPLWPVGNRFSPTFVLLGSMAASTTPSSPSSDCVTTVPSPAPALEHGPPAALHELNV